MLASGDSTGTQNPGAKPVVGSHSQIGAQVEVNERHAP